MAYSTVQDVLKAAGLGISVQRITKLHDPDMTDAQVTTMIEEWIDEADAEIKEELEVPMVVKDEIHIADGETSEFLLGPQDEEHYTVSKTVTDNLENIVHVYFGSYCEKNRRLRPFPTDCDGEYTETTTHANNWNATKSNCTVSKESTIIKCGGNSIKFVFSAAGYSRYTLTNSKNIDQYEYVAFAVYVSDPTATLTLKLFDEDLAYTSQDFDFKRGGVWYIYWIRIDNMSGTNNWETNKLWQIELASDKACTVYLDMFNFNDGYCWAAPQGYLYIHEAENAGEEPPTAGYLFYVTYEYDPYKSSTPELVRRASKYFAAADLVEHLIGLRQAHTGFEAEGATGLPNKESLMFNQSRLRAKGEKALENIGFGWTFDPIKG